MCMPENLEQDLPALGAERRSNLLIKPPGNHEVAGEGVTDRGPEDSPGERCSKPTFQFPMLGPPRGASHKFVARADDDVVVLGCFEHGREHRLVVLEVRVHHPQNAPRGLRKSVQYGLAQAVILGPSQDTNDAPIACGSGKSDLRCAIGRGIIADKDLIGPVWSRPGFEHGLEPRNQRSHITGFVECRHDEAEVAWTLGVHRYAPADLKSRLHSARPPARPPAMSKHS